MTGDPVVRETIENGASLTKLAATWRREIEAFRRESMTFRLYR